MIGYIVKNIETGEYLGPSAKSGNRWSEFPKVYPSIASCNKAIGSRIKRQYKRVFDKSLPVWSKYTYVIESIEELNARRAKWIPIKINMEETE